MKERPILFSAPMVRGMLRDIDPKTMTRRIVKGMALEWLGPDGFTPEFVASPENHLSTYGQPGDRLWVKETFFAFGRWETRYSEKKKRDEWHFVDMTQECGLAYRYAADIDELPHMLGRKLAGGTPMWWKRPAIFMPRAASRITLEITGVRVERLNDCSDADALAEGVDRTNTSISGYAQERYRRLWESLNGEKSWDVNPWVWVIEFRRLTA